MGKNKKMSEKKKNDEYLKIFMEFDLDSSGGGFVKSREPTHGTVDP